MAAAVCINAMYNNNRTDTFLNNLPAEGVQIAWVSHKTEPGAFKSKFRQAAAFSVLIISMIFFNHQSFKYSPIIIIQPIDNHKNLRALWNKSKLNRIFFKKIARCVMNEMNEMSIDNQIVIN